MKKALALLLSVALIGTLVFASISVFAAPKTLVDFESYTITETDTTNGYALETADPISGSKSVNLAYTSAAADGTGWKWTSPIGSQVADWSGYSYYAVNVKNTDAAHAIGIAFLFDFNDGTLARYIPTVASDFILRDAANSSVAVVKAATHTAGIGCPYVVIPAGFEGTLYVPLKDNAAFETPASFNSDNCPYNSLQGVAVTLQTEGAYSGSLIFDDVALYNASDIPAAVVAPMLLTGFEDSLYFNAYVPGGASPVITVAAETGTPLSGTTSLAFTNPNGPDCAYFYAFGGITNWSGYSYMSIRVKNTDTVNGAAFALVTSNQSECLTQSTNCILRDTNNNSVAFQNFDTYYALIPAGFDGTIYLPKTVDTVQEQYFRFSAPGAFTGKLLLDDITLLNATDIPAPATTAPVTTAPVTTAPVTTAPVTTAPVTTAPATTAPVATGLLLKDYEDGNLNLNGILPPGVMTCTAVTNGAISGTTSMAYEIDATAQDAGAVIAYMQPFGGVTSWADYNYLSMKIKNTDATNAVAFLFFFDQAEYASRIMLSEIADSIILIDTDNNEVDVERNGADIIIPAGFEGTLYISLDADYTIAEMYSRIGAPDGAFDGQFLIDDVSLVNDLPTETEEPGDTTAPVKTNDPDDIPDTGAPALIGLASLFALSSAYVVRRKRSK